MLLDDDFNLLVRDIDNDYPIERFSGGEQDDIAVALRIALSRYLAELHGVHESTFLIFDEIFGSQDEERRNNLLTALRTQESPVPPDPLNLPHRGDAGRVCQYAGDRDGHGPGKPDTGGGGLNNRTGYEESLDRALRKVTEHIPEDLVEKFAQESGITKDDIHPIPKEPLGNSKRSRREQLHDH